MQECDYQLWLSYHYGLLKRELTEEEYKEIRASEFAMHFLIPTKQLLKLCGGYKNLPNIDYARISELARLFEVSWEVMQIKIDSLMDLSEEEVNKLVAKQDSLSKKIIKTFKKGNKR